MVSPSGVVSRSHSPSRSSTTRRLRRRVEFEVHARVRISHRLVRRNREDRLAIWPAHARRAVAVCWKGDIASLISSPPGAAASSPRPDSIWSRSSCPEVRGSYSVDRLSAAGEATSASCCCPDGRRGGAATRGGRGSGSQAQPDRPHEARRPSWHRPPRSCASRSPSRSRRRQVRG
jgi:hypothetical protein